ncbi:heavy metal-binding domain-containing protein [Fructilactobacillus frigidiflavus]|uniref:heavy metal-binding domain-containing protein n=1 Tax=Fructilactobacillus frigidiflavus TaxID=3242688 RepID=UPI0037569961
MTEKMLVTTTEVPVGYEVEHVIGEVFGMTVQSKNIVSNIGASIKNVFGGEIKSYTDMLETARQESIDRMCANAAQMGGDAVVMMRFDSGSIGTDMMSITAYGTAVVLKQK